MKLPEFWKTYAAVAVLAAIAAYIFLVEEKKERKPEWARDKVFAGVEAATLKQLTIAPAEGETIRLVRGETGWTMAEPMAVAADSSAVESLASSFANMEQDEIAKEDAEALAEYGLDTPHLRIEAAVEGQAQPLALLVGAKLADGSGYYALRPGETRVFTVASWSVSSFEKKPFDLRDRDLLHVKRDDVRRLEVAGPEGGFVLEKDAGEAWAFTRPLRTRAGRWAVDGLVGTIESLRMEEVVSEDAKDLGRYGLLRPARSVTLGLEDGSSRVLEIGSEAGEKRYHARAAGSALVAVVPATLVDELAKGMAELRAKRVLEVATYEVEGFELAQAAGTSRFEKASVKEDDGVERSRWKRTAPEEKELDTNAVEDALFKLGGVEVQRFLDAAADPAAYGLDTPALKLSLRFSSDKPEEWLELGRKGDAVFARRARDEALLELDAAKAEELIRALSEL